MACRKARGVGEEVRCVAWLDVWAAGGAGELRPQQLPRNTARIQTQGLEVVVVVVVVRLLRLVLRRVMHAPPHDCHGSTPTPTQHAP